VTGLLEPGQLVARVPPTARSLQLCFAFFGAVTACNVPAEQPFTDPGVRGGSAGAPQAGSGGSGGAMATSGAAGSVGQAGVTGSAGQAQAGGAGQGGVAQGGAGQGGAGAPPVGGAGSSGAPPLSGGTAGASIGGASGSTSGAAGASGSGGSSGAGASAGTSSGGAGAGGAPTGPITIWIAGDSTVANGNTPCPTGWGKSFDALFDDRVSVTNSAVGGRSVRTWLYNVGTTMDSEGECVLATGGDGMPTIQARWQQMLDGMGPGDYLLIQFGINDGSATCDRHVGLEAFKSTYGVMAEAAKERGAQPVFITPVSAVACNGSTARETRGAYVTATTEAGMTYDVPVIDLHALSIDLYTASGFCPIPGGDVSASTTGPVGDFFCDDHTHFSPSGAEVIAGLVADAVRDAGLGLAAYLK